jgi:hypothetical protein
MNKLDLIPNAGDIWWMEQHALEEPDCNSIVAGCNN